MTKFLMVYVYCIALITGHIGFAMDPIIFQQNQQQENERLRKRIGQFDLKCGDELLPDDMQHGIASFMVMNFLQDTEIELREGLLLEDSLYGKIERAEISYNDKFLVTVAAASSNIACIWNMATGKLLHLLKGHDDSINIVKISFNDERLITHSIDNTIKIWNMPSGALEHTLKVDNVHLIALAHDNTQIVTVSAVEEGNNLLQIWSMQTGELLCVLERKEDHCIAAIAIAHGCKQLATASCNSSLKLWNMITGKLVRTFTQEILLTSHDMVITSNDNYLITGCDKKIYAWDMKTGQGIPTFGMYEKSIKSLFISLDNTKLVIITYDGLVEVWSMEGQLLHTFDSRHMGCSSMPFAFDRYGKKFLKALYDSSVRICDIQTGALLYNLQERRGDIKVLETNSDGTQVVTGSADNIAKIWSLKKSSARLWLENNILPFQSNLIARAYAATKAEKLFEITYGTDNMFIWVSLPNYVRDYLNLYLKIALISEPV